MLAQLRNMTRGWIAYVLLFLLTVAFAIWGVNDVFSGVGSRDVASVDGRSISPAQLSRELELTLRGQREQGVNITQQEAIDEGFHLRLLDGIIGRHALYAYARKIGVDASNRMVADRIRAIPAVNNPVTGTFDETAYAQFLQQLRYNQPEFEEDVRGDLARAMLLESLIEECGYSVAGPAARVAAALALAEGGALDAAVLDINLAGEPIFPVADALAARGIPFVFLTGYGRLGLPERFRDRAVVEKPIDPDKLIAAMDAALSRTVPSR